MPENRFLYPVHELLAVPKGTPVQLPARGPLNAPQLIGMLQQIQHNALMVVGVIVAGQMAAGEYRKNFDDVREALEEISPDDVDDLEATAVDRVLEGAQGVLAGRLANFGEEGVDLRRTIQLIEKVYEERWDSMPGAGAALMVAKAAHHLNAATTIAMMPPTQIPNHHHALTMEAAHAVMYAAQSKSRSQASPMERVALDLLTMVEPAGAIVDFLYDWWRAFIQSVVPQAQQRPEPGAAEQEYSALREKYRSLRPLTYKPPQGTGPDPLMLVGQVVEIIDRDHSGWGLDIQAVKHQDNALDAQLSGTTLQHTSDFELEITGGHIAVEWWGEDRKLEIKINFAYTAKSGQEHRLTAQCASEPNPDPVFVTLSTFKSLRSMVDLIAWGMRTSSS